MTQATQGTSLKNMCVELMDDGYQAKRLVAKEVNIIVKHNDQALS